MDKKLVSNLFTEIKGKTVSDMSDFVYADKAQKLYILPPGPDDQGSALEVGGPDGEFLSTASKTTVGTAEQTYYQEGQSTNPLSIYPSSFFMPVIPRISSVLSGPLSIISNPELLIAVIAITVAATQNSEEDSYSYHKSTLPVKVIDNQEIEDELFS